MIFARMLSFVLCAISFSISWVLFSVFRVRSRVILKNLDIVFGESKSVSEKQRMGRHCLAAFLRTVFEFLFSSTLYPFSKVDFQNADAAIDYLKKGQGVYVLGIHQGNWELLCHKGGQNLAKLHLAMKPIGGPRMAAWVRSRREKNCVHEIRRDAEVPAWQQVNSRLQEGCIVGFVMDQRRRKGVLAPFFGREALTNVSLFRQWKGCRAPIFPLTIRRTGLLSHEAIFWNEFEVWNEDGCSEEEFYQKNAVIMNAKIEEMVRWNSEEYFWMHDRWKV
jgi:KDO2-lipid IV(A) lauroyltransferase